MMQPMFSALTKAVVDILDYNGRGLDILINYSMSGLVFIMLTINVVLAATAEPRSSAQLRRSQRLAVWYVGLIIILFVLQIGICLAEECTGVSIVWSALLGYCIGEAINERKYFSMYYSPLALRMLFFCTFAGLGVWVYYAVVDTAITTLAHLLSVVLGGSIYLLLVSTRAGRCVYCREQDAGPMSSDYNLHTRIRSPRDAFQWEDEQQSEQTMPFNSTFRGRTIDAVT